MTKRKLIIIGAIVASALVVIAGVTSLLVIQNNRYANTHDVEVCSRYKDYNSAVDGWTDFKGCESYRIVRIANGSENIDHSPSYKTDCSEYGGEPLFDPVGGAVGLKFIGCEIK